MKHLLVPGLLLGLLFPGDCNAQPDLSAEVQQLMAGLESVSRVQQVNAAKVIARSGLRDQGLYQKVASLLRADYPEAQGYES